MNTAIIRGELKKYIERADDKHLQAIYTLLEKEISSTYEYDEETLKIIYKRVEDDDKGFSQSYSLEETMQFIRNAARGKK